MDKVKRVLFIDDDAQMRRAFARSLSELKDIELDVADGFNSAMQLAQGGTYAAIATDFALGEDTSGLDLLDKLWHLQPDATFILVSGNLKLDDTIEAVNEHNVSFVVKKPWDSHELVSIIQRSTDSHWERVTQRTVQKNLIEAHNIRASDRSRVQEAVMQGDRAVTEALLKVVHVRGHETLDHCHRVAGYCLAVARTLGVPPEDWLDIERGALLHDVGLVAIPDEIFFKQGALSEEEWALMRSHPERGAQMLEGVPSLKVAREIVLQHHERFNGTGYPRGLKGDEICVGARLFAVADTLEAISSERHYRKAARLEEAVAEVMRFAGSYYDPAVTGALAQTPVAVLEETRLKHRPAAPASPPA